MTFAHLRPAPVYLLALCLPLTMAGISISKFLVLIVALGVLVFRGLGSPQIAGLRSAPVLGVLVLLAAQMLGVLYSSVDWTESLGSVGKYGKLLLIPLVLVLLRNLRDARIALACYIAAQTFVVVTSWLLFTGLTVPWVPTAKSALGTVYSSYLDQAILTAGYVVLCWQMRHEFPGRYGRYIACGLVMMGALNVLVVLPGRSGQVCLLAAIALHAMWALPMRWRVLGMVSPVLVLSAAMLLSTQFKNGVMEIANGIKRFQPVQQTAQGGSLVAIEDRSSTGERLTFWYRSVQAIKERPLLGFGTGTWQQQYYRLESGKPSAATVSVRNPHQEYLFWGVQLGLVGMGLLIGWFASLAWQSLKYGKKYGHPLAAMLAVCVTACLFNSALYDGLVGDYFCAMLAILMAYGHYGLQEHGDKRVDAI